MTKNAISLIRVSTDQQDTKSQQMVNARTMERCGLNRVRTFEISDVSGSDVLKTPEMTELLEVIKHPDIHAVVVCEWSRLLRCEDFESQSVLQRFVDTGTELYTEQGPQDLVTPLGRFMSQIQVAFAGLEKSLIKNRMFRGKEEKRQRGECVQSSATWPFGVAYDKQRGWYYLPEAERVREAYKQLLAGNHSYKSLAKVVGVTRRGIVVILRNEIYSGWFVRDKRRDPSASGRYASKDGRQSDRRTIARKPEDVIRHQVIAEPLISHAEWSRAQEIMDAKQEQHVRSREHPSRFLYAGYLFCDKCGRRMQARACSPDAYVCKNRLAHKCDARYLNREKLERVLDSLITHKLSDKDFLRERIAEAKQRANTTEHKQHVERIKADLVKLEQKRKRIVAAYLEHGMIDDAAEYKRQLVPVDADLKTRRAALAEAEAEIPAALADDERLLLHVTEPWLRWHSDCCDTFPDIRKKLKDQ